MSVADYLPEDYVRDGSVSYQQQIQQAIDEAAEAGRPLEFPAITYAVDESGWQLRSGSRLWMHGARFEIAKTARQDGALFRGEDVKDVELVGGLIQGHNETWPEGVNIRGIWLTGQCARIRIRDLEMYDLSSNGIGLFGNPTNRIRQVWVRDVTIVRGCNRYPDYLSNEPWEQGSTREDQGLIAFYYVDDFLVSGCRLAESRADATHFYRCRRGQIIANHIETAKMGGYFVESCEAVIGANNLIRLNGSRGATIERGSRNCIFADNVVIGSGREGLWAPDCIGLVVTGNVFDRNGRKVNGPEPWQIWNANLTINEARIDPSNSPVQDYLIAHNLFYTDTNQVAAIRVVTTTNTSSIVFQGNLLRGPNKRLQVEGTARDEVYLMP